MSLWNDPSSKILAAIVVALLIGRTRSFPAVRVLPSAETQEYTSSETATQPTINRTDDSAVTKTSAEQRTKAFLAEERESPQLVKLDYYDYLQLPNDPDDEILTLPDNAVNVNEDYAGIYDYRGSQDGRFRRKRTLTTNVEQLLTRSSRLRSKRSLAAGTFEDGTVASPAEQAENLVTLLSVMQDSDPDFDAAEFLKVLDAPSVSEQDLEYLLFLSNLASQKDSALQREFRPSATSHRRRPGATGRVHQQKSSNQPFYLSPDFVLPSDTNKDRTWFDGSGRAKTSHKNDISRVFAMASLLGGRSPSAGMAM